LKNWKKCKTSQEIIALKRRFKMTTATDYKFYKPGNKPADIDTKLKELEEKLQKAETEVTEKTGYRDYLKTDIQELQQIHDDFAQIYAAYVQVYDSNITAKKDFDIFIPGKHKEIAGKLSPQVMEEIDKIVSKVVTAIEEKRETVKELQERYEEAQNQCNIDDKIFTEAKDTFEFYKKKREEIEGKLTKLKSLRDTIKSNEDEGKEGYLLKNYFWIKKLTHDNAHLHIKTPPEFWNIFIQKWHEMDEAKAKFRASEREMNKAKGKYDKEQESLKKLDDNFANDILNEIAKIQISDCLKTQTSSTTEEYSIATSHSD
jgi:chromosome segregation ATPase